MKEKEKNQFFFSDKPNMKKGPPPSKNTQKIKKKSPLPVWRVYLSLFTWAFYLLVFGLLIKTSPETRVFIIQGTGSLVLTGFSISSALRIQNFKHVKRSTLIIAHIVGYLLCVFAGIGIGAILKP